MSHGYVRSTWGCHCFQDSSFKRYNRAHLGGDFTINIFSGANTCVGNCGCGHVNGFWGGFGLALGNFAGNLLMGGMNMLGGMFGGLGGMFGGLGGMMGGMPFGMGGILGGFGGGWGNSGWGNSGFGNNGVKGDDYYASKYGGGKSNSNDKVDKDNPKIKAYSKSLDDVKTKSLNQTEYDAQCEKLRTLHKELDGNQDDCNEQWLKDLLNKLNEKAGDGVKTYKSVDDLLKGADAEPKAKTEAVEDADAKSKDKTKPAEGAGNPVASPTVDGGNSTVNTANNEVSNVQKANELKKALDSKLKAINSNLSVELNGNKITVKGILFETGKAEIDSRYKDALKAVSEVFKTYKDASTLTITGNTSKLQYPQNSIIENTKLADSRATIVGMYFMNYCAIDQAKIKYGELGVETDKYGEEPKNNQNVVLEIEIQ